MTHNRLDFYFGMYDRNYLEYIQDRHNHLKNMFFEVFDKNTGYFLSYFY